MELSSIEDIVVSSFIEIILKLLNCRSDQHVGHEQSMIGASADNSDSNSLLGAPSSVSIHNINDPTSIQIASGQVAEDLKGSRLHAPVDISPSDFLLSDGVCHDGLGSWRSSKY